MLNYDDFDFKPYLIVNDIKRPILPPQLLSTKTILGKSGAYFFSKQHEPIVIPVSVTIKEKTLPDFRERVRFLAGKLNKHEPKKIIFSDEPNAFIKGIVDGSTDLENIFTIGKGDINFYCPDPYYYAIEDEVFTFNSVGDYDFTRSKGNTDSLPIIEIEGRNNGVITIETDNTKINFDGMLSKGEKLVFDSKLMTSYIVETDGGKRSGNNDIDTMIFPFLTVGANNIKVSVSGDSEIKKISIYAKSRWT